ncbi:MAG: hypothetical protein QOI89_552 [Solirubrobacteraceae bacterium]|nr:hypothetical protein [Solirubrobacteraceae bacterium]
MGGTRHPSGYDQSRRAMSAPMGQLPEAEYEQQPKRRRSRGEIARTAALIILAILATLFAVLNVKEVKVNWVFGSGRAPLIIVIVVSLLAGIVLSYFADRLARKRR